MSLSGAIASDIAQAAVLGGEDAAESKLLSRLLPRTHLGEQVKTTVYVDLAVDVVQVGLDRRQRDKQLTGNIRIALALDHFQDDLPLPVGDAVFCEEGFRNGVCPQWG